MNVPIGRRVEAVADHGTSPSHGASWAAAYTRFSERFRDPHHTRFRAAVGAE
jgi:hypothetical protein